MATKFEDKTAKSAEAAYAAASATLTGDKAAPAPAAAPVKIEAAKVSAPVAAAKPATVKAPAKTIVAKKAATKKVAPKAKTVKVAVKSAAPKKTVKTVAAKAAPKTIKTIKTIKAAPKAVAAPEGIQKMTNTVKNYAEDAKAKAEEFFGDYSEKAKAAADKGQLLAKDAVEFTKGNVEAIVEAGKIGLKGGQDMARDYVDFAKKSFEESTAAMKKVAAVKSPTEFFQLQGELSRGAFDAAVKQTSKNSEAALKLANDMIQPISNRVAVAVSKIKSAA